MSNLVETETSEAEVTIAGVTAKPPTITVVHAGRDTQGARREFVQQVPVRDAGLASRALSELHKGDRAKVTVINEWYEDHCDTYLEDYNKLTDVEDTEQETAVKNGTTTAAHTIVKTETIIPPARRSKMIVNH